MANSPYRSGEESVDEVRQRLEREAEAARQAAGNVTENVKQKAQDVASDVQAQAQEILSEQKEKAKSSIMDLCSAIRRAADDLESHEQPQIANLARSLASGIEDFSQAIGRRNFQDMLGDVQKFVRDHPTAVFGGAVLAGLAIARFAKSSSHHPTSQRATERMGTQQQTGLYGQHPGQEGQFGEYPSGEWEQGRRGVEGSVTR